ncbi:alpha/beta hydrolase [Paenibacillus sp. GCM10012306]|uniref:alpha/beta hydrolase n=1 Tax=Paenibacillus sp. GCM10012306 TaxID=3317342 RepID=UPI003619419C
MLRTSVEQLEAIKDYLRQNNNYASQTVAEIRRSMANSAAGMPRHDEITYRTESIGSLRGEWAIPGNLVPDMENKAILYFHGGGFVAGTCDFYRDLCTRIAKSSGIKILAVEYRLAPEHPFPAANDDCLNTYRWLRNQGYAAGDIILGGDSVGGTLVLMTLLSLRDQGEELPAGAFLLSPHTDLVHLDGESYSSRAALDPTGSRAANERILEDYASIKEAEHPLLSPLRMDLHGLPHLWIQVGDHEVLLSDAIRLQERADAAGVKVELEIWENMWSVFQFLAHMLPEAQQAIDHIGGFVRKRLEGTSPSNF